MSMSTTKSDRPTPRSRVLARAAQRRERERVDRRRERAARRRERRERRSEEFRLREQRGLSSPETEEYSSSGEEEEEEEEEDRGQVFPDRWEPAPPTPEPTPVAGEPSPGVGLLLLEVRSCLSRGRVPDERGSDGLFPCLQGGANVPPSRRLRC
jgi:hypothetical protein